MKESKQEKKLTKELILSDTELIYRESKIIALLTKIEFQESYAVPTACVTVVRKDNSWKLRIYYNPKFLAQVNHRLLVMHEIGHIILNHFQRQGDKKRELWNIATDLAVNSLLDDPFYTNGVSSSVIEGSMFPRNLSLPAYKCAEWYYETLMKNEKIRQQAQELEKFDIHHPGIEDLHKQQHKQQKQNNNQQQQQDNQQQQQNNQQGNQQKDNQQQQQNNQQGNQQNKQQNNAQSNQQAQQNTEGGQQQDGGQQSSQPQEQLDPQQSSCSGGGYTDSQNSQGTQQQNQQTSCSGGGAPLNSQDSQQTQKDLQTQNAQQTQDDLQTQNAQQTQDDPQNNRKNNRKSSKSRSRKQTQQTAQTPNLLHRNYDEEEYTLDQLPYDIEAELNEYIEDIKKSVKTYGTGSVFIKHLIEIEEDYMNDRRNRWKRLLERYIQDYLDEFKRDYTRRHKRFFAIPKIFVESMKLDEAIAKVAIALDCSGSISNEELKEFLQDTIAILEANMIQKVDILQFDDGFDIYYSGDTKEALKVLSKKFVRNRDGGTSFVDICKYAEENADLLIVFTDLEGAFPNKAPDIPVIWCSTYHDKAPFGDVIKIEMNN